MKRKAKKRNQTTKPKSSSSKNHNLYEALTFIYQFSKLEDLFLLKESKFLSICDLVYIGWDLEKDLFKNTSLFERNNDRHPVEASSPYWVKHPLDYKDTHYGYLTFVSNNKISQTKKRFLEKVSGFVASSIHFIKNKELSIKTEQEWNVTFNSFYKPLCITDKNFHILKSNQSFLELAKKQGQDLLGKNIFKQFPFPIKNSNQEGSWISKGMDNGNKVALRFTMKSIFLSNERANCFVILVEDVTEQAQMEEIIAQQAKVKELGLIKASIAHQLNNPIAGIKMLIHVIQKTWSQSENKNTSLEDIFKDLDEAVLRCQKIISELLNNSHPDEKEPRPSPSDLNL